MPPLSGVYNVLFLCTGNSCRSILAEAILNKFGEDRLQGYSAGSFPTGAVHPLALETLARFGHSVEELRSKSWDEFAVPSAPPMDFNFTMCDNAAKEICPVWPGHPTTAHWGLPDPATFKGSETEQRLVFERTYHRLEGLLRAFIALPLETMAATDIEVALHALAKEHAGSDTP